MIMNDLEGLSVTLPVLNHSTFYTFYTSEL